MCGVLQQRTQSGFHVFDCRQLVGDCAACEQKLASTTVDAIIGTLARHATHPGFSLIQGCFQFLHQLQPQFLELIQAFAGAVAGAFIHQALAEQHTQPRQQSRRHQLAECQSTEAAGVQPVLHLAAAVTAGFAPVGEVFAVVEQQVVVLFADATHGPAQGDASR